ncbi:hypothetical protein DX933_00360 [Ornithinibacillus gellani]|uniref:PucR family transcriptional regulator n=1 Tax=Ornithinibacillus gellani TaxID=2293253 RepID=UPI000F482624|nr:helix-turn-helix domain-containing protein [Ornithinibacillus gellani]TQS76592.1 hypothetical protein DX933_00360 [Ornithinibacillus gellani]
MLKQLKTLFPSLLPEAEINHDAKADYCLFITANKAVIGIHKQELQERDIQLLSAFLEPYNANFPVPTSKELNWMEKIQQDSEDIAKRPYRFVYFSIPGKEIEPTTFKEAITEVFKQELPIIWNTAHEGIIIEEMSTENGEAISYKQIINVLMSDLYVKMNFFVGPFQSGFRYVTNHYNQILDSGKLIFTHTDKNVLTYVEAIPLMYVKQATSQMKDDIRTNILGEFAHDPDFLKTINMLFQCNLNISETAKKLYLHRNTLQYRLDKFYDQTGTDIRDFHQAITVFLALLSN